MKYSSSTHHTTMAIRLKLLLTALRGNTGEEEKGKEVEVTEEMTLIFYTTN